ncbi:MAG: hypothetical protein LQ340_003606 [Diploschistes diacapsis]|nr:MAG: hypothetical protein LQ340_003606 [Diploschistes diacapsis]
MQGSALSLGLLTFAPSALAWGNLGHETIAYIASDFVTSNTQSWAQKILGDTSDDYLASVATWADTYKYTSAGRFSEPFHFIDANDSPPQTCNVEYSRDCGEDNCVVSAIVNYVTTHRSIQCSYQGLTLILQTSLIQGSSTSASEKHQSLMFLVHFLGDIHQPLHNENLEVGGNDIDVKFGSSSTNLHHVWDTNGPEQYAGDDTLENARTFATQITSQIKSGIFSTQASGWLTDMSISSAQSSAMSWASDANQYVCSAVMPGGVSSVENQDLSGAYYQNMMPTVKLQFAKAGYRLAAWLNLLATGSTGLTS